MSEVVAYRSISDMPSVQNLAIQVCTLLVPTLSVIIIILFAVHAALYSTSREFNLSNKVQKVLAWHSAASAAILKLSQKA